MRMEEDTSEATWLLGDFPGSTLLSAQLPSIYRFPTPQTLRGVASLSRRPSLQAVPDEASRDSS